MLQRVAVWSLQIPCTAADGDGIAAVVVCCSVFSVLQCVAVRCVAACCSEVCCSVLQCVAACCSVLQ